MRVVFLHVGNDLAFPTIMVASVKRVMPTAEVWQLTDFQTPHIEGADYFAKMPFTGNLMSYRLNHLAALEGPFVSLDTDVIVQGDLSPVFNHEFDVALTKRTKEVTLRGRSMIDEQPYNSGVMFSKSSDFWAEACRHCQTLPENQQKWFGEQLTIAALAKSGKYNVLDLDCEEWNFSPDDEDDDTSHAKVVHYKGRRKEWMRNRGFLDLVAKPAIRSGQWQTM